MPYQSNPPIDSEKELYASKYKFIDHLNKLPQFEVRLGKLSRIEEGFKQKRVDILMMMDLVRLSQQKIIQKAILITGDSDFVPAIQEAKDVGVLTHVFFFRSKLTSIHNELYNVCDNRTEFTQEMIDSCLR